MINKENNNSGKGHDNKNTLLDAHIVEAKIKIDIDDDNYFKTVPNFSKQIEKAVCDENKTYEELLTKYKKKYEVWKEEQEILQEKELAEFEKILDDEFEQNVAEHSPKYEKYWHVFNKSIDDFWKNDREKPEMICRKEFDEILYRAVEDFEYDDDVDESFLDEILTREMKELVMEYTIEKTLFSNLNIVNNEKPEELNKDLEDAINEFDKKEYAFIKKYWNDDNRFSDWYKYEYGVSDDYRIERNELLALCNLTFNKYWIMFSDAVTLFWKDSLDKPLFLTREEFNDEMLCEELKHMSLNISIGCFFLSSRNSILIDKVKDLVSRYTIEITLFGNK